MESTKPPIPRHFLIAIITFIITVMQLMIKCSERQPSFVFDEQIFIASMGHRRTRPLIDNMEEQMDWMRWHHAVNEQG